MKSKNAFLKILVPLLLLSSGARAGDKAGNGGDAIVCLNANGSKTVRLLDVYEAKKYFKYDMDLGSDDLTSDDKVRLVIQRLKERVPVLAKMVEAKFGAFYRNAEFVYSEDLRDISDSDHVSIPSGCKIEQLVMMQQKAVFPGQKKYTINGDLWRVMDANNQAATMLHEFFYEEAKTKWEHVNSVPARRFNGLVLSSQFTSRPSRDLALELLGFATGYPDEGNIRPSGSVVFISSEAESSNGKEELLFKSDIEVVFTWYKGTFWGVKEVKNPQSLPAGTCDKKNNHCWLISGQTGSYARDHVVSSAWIKGNKIDFRTDYTGSYYNSGYRAPIIFP